MSKQTAYDFWIKERHNPQLGVYYVAEGQISNTAAKRMESSSVYGHNVMHRFSNEGAYRTELERLRNKGERVQ